MITSFKHLPEGISDDLDHLLGDSVPIQGADQLNAPCILINLAADIGQPLW
jgi:hypothetical protein